MIQKCRRLGWALGGLLFLWPLSAPALSLPADGVTPRIFSPNNDSRNDFVVFRLDNPTLAVVQGRVMDVSGGEIADLVSAGLSGIYADALMWDGRDRTGNVVPAGPYVYEIQGGDDVIRGVVVVAR